MADARLDTQPPPDDVMITLEGLGKHYDGQASDAVAPSDLDVRRGEFAVVLGPSGCGKITTLRMINRLVTLRALNAQVDVGGDMPEVVAKQWLQEKDFVR